MISEAPQTYTLLQMLSEMDQALADEIKEQSSRRSADYIAVDGKLITEESGRSIYVFSLKDPWEPEDDTPVRIKISGVPSIKGDVVTSTGTMITIATEAPLPAEGLRQIELINDATELLERLREALKNNNEGSAQMGSKAFGLCNFTAGMRSSYISSGVFRPDPSQKQAIEMALGSEVMYLIGPPGTGKTSTLAEMAFTHLREGHTVLIAAHTNIAVDNAIMKLAEICQKAGALTELHSGLIVRYGPPQDRRLMDDDTYADVYLPKIAKRMGSDLHRQSEQLKASLEKVIEQLATMKQVQEEDRELRQAHRESFSKQCEALRRDMASLQEREEERWSSLEMQLSSAGRQWQQVQQKANAVQQELRGMVAQQVQLQSLQADYQSKIYLLSSQSSEARQMNVLKRRLKRINLNHIDDQLTEVKHQLWRDGQLLSELQLRMDVAHRNYEVAVQQVNQLASHYNTIKTERDTPSDDAKHIEHLRTAIMQYEERIKALDASLERERKNNEQRRHQLECERAQIEEQIAAIDKQLADLERSIVAQARVVATTLSKTYMNKSLSERRFNIVILDEVSMAPLPAVYVAASHADQSVVAIGDPKQLAPIVSAKTPASQKWLGTDLFVHRGITLETSHRSGTGNSAVLKVQSRMHPAISVIARKHVYNGLIEDREKGSAKKWQPYVRVEPLPGQPLLLCDTSDAMPFATRPEGGSRINIYHALCTITLARQVLDSLPPPDLAHGNAHRIGLVTPYRKQAKLLQQLIRDAGLKDLVRAGTVHKFQGLEFDAVIFDTVESSPLRIADNFIRGSEAMRLINVAVTRPRHKLIIVANGSYIQNSFQKEDTMWLAVEEARKAAVLQSKNILNIPLPPLSETLRRLLPQHEYKQLHKSDLSVNQYSYELFNEGTFFPRFLTDAQKASKEIVIFSPFLAPKRTSAVLPVLSERIQAGIRVAVRTKPSVESNETAGNAESLLKRAGIEVINISGMHEKLVVIDEEIVYIGSLNVLSHYNTSEMMLRVQSPSLAKMALKIQETHRKKEAIRATPSELEKQGPVILIHRGKLPEETCERCGASMILRSRNADEKFFYGCGNYPDCKYTKNISEKHLIGLQQLQNRHCDSCCNVDAPMRVRTHDKDMWLECATPTPCGHWQSIVIL